MKTHGHLFTLSKDFFDNAVAEGGSDHESENLQSVIDQRLQAADALPQYTDRQAEDENQEDLPDPICQTCSVAAGSLRFHSSIEQREHFKSDWHRCNLKRKLHGRLPLDEANFEALIREQDEISSISGSDSSDAEAPAASTVSSAHAALVNFNSTGTRFAIWRALLGPDAKGASHAVLKQRLQSLRDDSGFWAVILSRGGHFAAAVFACRTSLSQPEKATKGAAAPLFQVVAHKTFHRYVVRAKAGGKQSGKDATGKFAKSAGSQIRRYNEAALRQDILDTLQSWRPHLERASHIFIAAPGGNEAILFETGASPLERGDPRIARVPFTTKRPTFSEAKRVVTVLLEVNEPDAAPAALPVQVAAKVAQPAKEAARPAAAAQEPAAEAPAPEPPLHQAARQGDAETVARLLEEGHDPTVSVGKTAYAMAANKAVRDTFRRRMAAAPEQWDWAAADVPSALTSDLEEQHLAREAQKKAKLKEREKERKKRAAERKKSQQAGASAAAEAEISAAAAQAAAQAPRGKEAENKVQQRAQQELERRRDQAAAAAEARMAALKVASRQQQLW